MRDITEGIMDTGVRAVVHHQVRRPTSQAVTPDVERASRAAAQAQRATGVPISTHTHAASEMGRKQLDVFESEGERTYHGS